MMKFYARQCFFLDSVWWIVILLLLSCQFRFHRADSSSWNSDDEQSRLVSSSGQSFYRYVQKKLPINDVSGTKSGDSSSDSQSSIDSVEEQNDVEDNEISGYTPKVTKSTVRQTMDNIVRDMRTKAMSKVYQSIEAQQPTEQLHLTNSFDDGDSGGISGSDEQPASSGKGNIRIAVHSKRRYKFIPVHFDRDDIKNPRMIEIVSDTMPLRLHFKSQSAAIVVTQSHMSPPMKPIDETVTMDQPYRLSHEVHKPIIQEVKEIIQPYRNIVQQLKPVIEDIKTIVPKDSDVDHQHSKLSQTRQSTNSDWSPMPSLNRRPNLRPPLPRPGSPSKQLQAKYSNSRSQHSSQVVEGVKTSESRPKIQRRMHRHVESEFTSNQNNRFRQPKRERNQNQRQRYSHSPSSSSSFSNQMQFGSSSPQMVYHPIMNNHNRNNGDRFFSNKNDQDNSGTLNDYYMSKDRYRPMSNFDFNGDRGGIEFGGSGSESVRFDQIYTGFPKMERHDPRHHYEDSDDESTEMDDSDDSKIQHGHRDMSDDDGDLSDEDSDHEDANFLTQSSETIGETMTLGLKSRDGSLCAFAIMPCSNMERNQVVVWPMAHFPGSPHHHSHHHHHHHDHPIHHAHF